MTLKECYTALGSDYTEVIKRLKKEKMVSHFVKMFVEEDYHSKLKDAILSGDVQIAFRATHSLKGNCMSLGFTRLQELAAEITEPLRSGQLEEAAALLKPLETEYERTVDIIRQLED